MDRSLVPDDSITSSFRALTQSFIAALLLPTEMLRVVFVSARRHTGGLGELKEEI